MRARDVMSDNVVSIDQGAMVVEAARLLVNARVSALPVIDAQGHMVGILSEADVIRGIAAQSDPGKAIAEAEHRRVSDIMSRIVVTATEDTGLNELANLMLSRNIKRVPILRDRKVVGVVSRADLLKSLISLGPDAFADKPAAAQVGDDSLHSAVMAALEQHDWSRARRSDVVVSQGVVHLWGMVASDTARTAYVDAAGQVPGVKSVKNHIHVGRLIRAGRG
jgi:CBS domain-containing protein